MTAISRRKQFKDSAQSEAVSEMRSTSVIFFRTFSEEGHRCCTIIAIRYFAHGIKARGQETDV
jgi:hypothetical protein